MRVKEFVIKAKDRDTTISGTSTGHPVRCLRNKLTRKFDEMEKSGTPPEEIDDLGVGSLRLAMVEGDIENGTVMAGQVCGMVKKVQPAHEIIMDIMNSAESTLSRLNNQVV
jgi:enoyl-[acyl-carrier protein] reductase II